MSQLHCICLFHMIKLIQIVICNNDYKFAAFLHSILQKFAVNEVTYIFHPEIVMMLTISVHVPIWF